MELLKRNGKSCCFCNSPEELVSNQADPLIELRVVKSHNF